MALTVEFNHERPFRTIEVYDVWADAVLSSEFEAAKLSRAQFCPQLSFRSRQVQAQSAFQVKIVWLPLPGSRHVALSP